MPTHNQKTVDYIETTKAKGSSDSTNIKSIFSTSPIHSGEYNRAAVLSLYQSLISEGGDDGGHTFGAFTFNYATNGAPNYETIDATLADGNGGGDAHNSKVPNPSSPGEGNGIDPTKQPKAPEEFASSHSSQFGVGQGSDLSPNTSSADISSHTVRTYDLGSSPKATS